MQRYQLNLGLILTVLLALAVNQTDAGNWPNWRGPHDVGFADGEDYPITWSDTKNVKWKVRLPGLGGSTPIVWGDLIFLSCSNDKNRALCYNIKGKRQWEQAIGSGKQGKHRKATGANPSAVTDGKHVYFYYKSGDLACLDFKGHIVWQKNLQESIARDTLNWDLGTSPVLTDKDVIIACMQNGPSYIAAFDKRTGKLSWKESRDLDAPSEANDSYTSPQIISTDGQQKIITVGADFVTAHDAASGKELWRVGGLNPKQQGHFRSIASPVVAEGIVVAPYARGSSITAVKLGGTGDVTDSHVAWTKIMDGRVKVDVPTPAIYGGKIYICADRGNASCFDLKSGKQIWSLPLERNRTGYSASPVIAAGRMYVTREDGKSFVINIENDKPELLASNDIDEFTVATPAFVDGMIFMRTHDHLWCIAK